MSDFADGSSTRPVAFPVAGPATVQMGMNPGMSSDADSCIGLAPAPRVLVALRIVVASLLAALLWKWPYFAFVDAVYLRYPVADDFFPAWLQHGLSLRIAFGITALSLLGVLVTSSADLRRSLAWFALAGSTVLVWHQGTYNDMTFATAWWTSLWLVWLTGRMRWLGELTSPQARADGAALVRRAAFLSRLILSMILLGGAVGKWTPEYWSGQVFYDIYFVDRDFWLFNWLRATFPQDTLREMAMWYSRKAVTVETLGGLGLWLLPPRWAAVAGMVVFTSIALLSNFLLFSVLLSLIGLASVGLLVGPCCKSSD